MSQNRWIDESRYEYYVELSTPRPRRWTAIEHDRFTAYSGRLELEMKAVTPVFVGTGAYEPFEPQPGTKVVYQPFASIRDRADPMRRKLVIPGTTLKGVVRTYAEALSPSCEAGRCRTCICCTIFGCTPKAGRPGFLGRITFLDTRPLDPEQAKKYNIVTRWGRRNRDRGGRRFYFHDDPQHWQAENDQAGEWVEAVRPGTQFHTELHLSNLSLPELGLLLLAMGMAPGRAFQLKLGGGKNRGLGSVKFHLRSGTFLGTPQAPGNAYRVFAPQASPLADSLQQQAVNEYWAVLGEEARTRIEEILQGFHDDPRATA